MNEYTTNRKDIKEMAEVYSESEISNTQGVGERRKRSNNSREISNPSEHALWVEKVPGKRSRDIFKQETLSKGPSYKGIRKRESKVKRSLNNTDSGVDVIKKKDEFGLSGRRHGSEYDKKQRVLIIKEVSRLKALGISKSKALKGLGVCRSTYYSWLKNDNSRERVKSVQRITTQEYQAVIDKKKEEPHLSHRKISGWLRESGYWISPSSCYRILKDKGWVYSHKLREKPWQTAHYEPYKPNMIWGEDWTVLTIAQLRYYLITIIDFFSRYIVAWGIVKTVNQKHVKDILALAYLNEKIDQKAQKPMLRFDRGSPNMALSTRKFIKEIELILSPSRTNRPTDNARQERWYRTVKQEEIYCYPEYPSVETAEKLIGRFIHEYNERRPHQALWNFTPAYVHRIGSKSIIYKLYKRKVKEARQRRIVFHTEQVRGINSKLCGHARNSIP